MRVVHVTYLETCSFPGKSSGTEGGETTLMSDFSKRVRLIHELAQLRSAEERIDDGRQCLRIDQVNRVELLAVADVHPLPDGPGHSGEAYVELVRKLLANRPDAPVAQVIDVIDGSFRVDKLNQVLDDFDDVILRENPHIWVCRQAKLLIQTIAAYVAQIVSLLGEEQLVDDIPCGCLIRRFGITQLFVNVVDSLDLRVRRIFLKGIEDDGIFICVSLIFLKEDVFHVSVADLGDGIIV